MKFSAFIFLVCSLSVQAGDLAQQRAMFRTAYAAAINGVPPGATVLDTLRDYPLRPYLEYHGIRVRLRALPEPEVTTFLARERDSLLGARLRTEWLRETARRGRFDLFMDAYTPQGDPELRCHALAREFKDRTPPRAVKTALAMWLNPRSQPAPCDPVFATLRARGVLHDDLVWQRIVLAARAGNPQFAASIARRFARPSERALADLFVRVWQSPAQTLQIPALRHDTPRVRDVVTFGLSRLARQHASRAREAWRVARPQYAFTPTDRGFVTRELALAAASQDHAQLREFLAAVTPAGVDDAIERLRLREGLRARDWERLLVWTRGAPRGATTNALRWRYWQARALEETGSATRARAAFAALARERDYYGFLASDRLGAAYTMTHAPIAPDATERTEVAALPGLVRAAEFYRLGMKAQARSELDYELSGRDRRTQEIAAVLTHDWGWHDRTIMALGQLQSYDDLELRFPLLHRPLIERFAHQRGVLPALIYAIVRGESAFVTDARSVAGALGLMQVMPATAATTARHLGVNLRSPRELVEVEKNLAIGSEYLRQVLRQFGGSFPLAAAAYNAGPSRVKAWLKGAQCTPPDIWVELIPFAETEGYVKRALFYAAIYEWRLGVTVGTLADRMKTMTQPAGASRSC
ncbi:MAG: transglycosylase SLT domain-containing protein [Gammaproteobacteria bacterium]